MLLCLADTRVEFAAEVNKYSRDGKVRLGRSLSFLSLKVFISQDIHFLLSQEQDRLLILTTSCLYVITQVRVGYLDRLAQFSFKTERGGLY